MANILVLGAKVPFTSGGQEILVSTLIRELKARDHRVDLVDLPYQALPKEDLLRQAAYWRSIDFTSFGETKVDLVIATKFPTYYAKHPKKSLWLVHQHRPAYDLYAGRYSDISDDPRDEQFRQLIVQGDNKVIAECEYISGISKNVIERLQHYNQIVGEVLYPPLPMGNSYRTGEFQDYILSVGRLCSIKRVDLMLKAMPIVHGHVKLKIVGTPDEPGIMEYFQNEIAKHSLQSRIEFLGRVSEEDLLSLFANALGVFYAPHNEDYGYVTLEAFASGKPVLTAHDSGGVLEFVHHEQNGLILEPTIDAFGHAANRLVENKPFAEELGKNGKAFIEKEFSGAGWDRVIERLLSPLQGIGTERESIHIQSSQIVNG
ncbi:MAG: glycosyltransferase family 4 protein [Bdellovibrionales bacterium]|nr:glycosyltransferase family 4 protein [Bdellovibrionales bacterium]